MFSIIVELLSRLHKNKLIIYLIAGILIVTVSFFIRDEWSKKINIEQRVYNGAKSDSIILSEIREIKQMQENISCEVDDTKKVLLDVSTKMETVKNVTKEHIEKEMIKSRQDDVLFKELLIQFNKLNSFSAEDFSKKNEYLITLKDK